MNCVDIYIKQEWHGGFRGAGEAAALMLFVDRKGQEHKKVVTVSVRDGTRDRLQLMALIKAMHSLKGSCAVGVYVDNRLIRYAIENNWIRQWRENNWINKRGQAVKNADLWSILLKLIEIHSIGVMGYIARYEPELEKALKGGMTDGK